ncbi:tetratricopeptide repeat protein, partial [Methylicorpusculum sp.]|uniref:tetratricopeptide repeat protein n=1 Tax=Methylicorpusculum sp. TaxID=2713644 RepID=UPI002ABC4031
IIVVIQTWLSYEQITDFSVFFKLQPNGQELDFTFVRLAPAKNLAMKLAMAARGCDKDDDLAFLWLTKAAYQDHPDASYWQGLCYRDGIGTQQNDELTFACFKKAAEQGCSDAYYWLALYYLNGKGCQQNDELAFVWITKAVEYADAYFLFNITTGFGINLAEIYLFIGKLYAEGKGVVQNDELAFKWFAKAAEHKLAKAQYCLADCYEYGKGVDRNINLADKWYEEADQQDHFEAEDQFRLAERFLQKNYNLGMKWMIRSAHAGNSDAYNWLINAFLNLAIPEELLDKVNDAELYKFTFDWCSKKALSNNETEANLLLGSLYSAGKGIQQSDDLAFDCFERAQKTFGDLDPEPEDMLTDLYLQLYLSNCYAQGKGVNKDLSKAESYFRYYSDYLDTLGSNF